jgi:hypothetical protein
MSRPLTESVRVKNTFIDGFDSDEEGDMPIMTQVKSCPAKACEHRALVPATLQGVQAVPTPAKAAAVGAPPLPMTSEVPPPPSYGDGADLERERRSCAGAATWSLAAEEPMALEEPASVTVEPLETRQPRRSRGAILHPTGLCRPCAWYWKPQGCNLGYKCCHCHMCPKTEIKARKKTKKLQIRAPEEAEASG